MLLKMKNNKRYSEVLYSKTKIMDFEVLRWTISLNLLFLKSAKHVLTKMII